MKQTSGAIHASSALQASLFNPNPWKSWKEFLKLATFMILFVAMPAFSQAQSNSTTSADSIKSPPQLVVRSVFYSFPDTLDQLQIRVTYSVDPTSQELIKNSLSYDFSQCGSEHETHCQALWSISQSRLAKLESFVAEGTYMERNLYQIAPATALALAILTYGLAPMTKNPLVYWLGLPLVAGTLFGLNLEADRFDRATEVNGGFAPTAQWDQLMQLIEPLAPDSIGTSIRIEIALPHYEVFEHVINFKELDENYSCYLQGRKANCADKSTQRWVRPKL